MTAVEKIQSRISELQRIHATDLAYIQHRVNERDWHGAWDGAIGLAEWEIEVTALEFAIRCIEEAA